MLDLKAMIELQAARSNKINALLDNYTKRTIQERTKSVIKTSRNELEAVWCDYQAMHLLVFGDIPEKERNEKHPYLKEYAATDVMQFKFKSKLDYQSQLLDDEQAAQIGAQQNQAIQAMQQHVPNAPKSRLPPIKIDNFTGDYHRWTSFKSLYTSLIHQKEDISAVEKFHYLLSFLSGDASRLISHYAITAENYATAWRELQNRYDNKRALVNCELKRFMDIPAVSIESAEAIRNVVDTARECFNSLANLAINSTSWDPIIIFLLVQKLDAVTHRYWELSLTEPKELPSLENFYNFLENRFHALKNLPAPANESTAVSRLQHNTESKKPYINPFRRQQTNPQSFLAHQIACDICKEQHIFRHCPQFINANQFKRSELVMTYNRCSNCLGTHDANSCRSASRCQKCNQRHNTLLHPNSSAIETSGAMSSTAIITSHHSGRNAVPSQVLLATALVRVNSANGSEHIIRCLLDQGSQSSFITEEAAQLLRLRRSSVLVPITGLGSVEAETSKNVVCFNMQSRHSTFNMEVQALIISKITNSLPSSKIQVKQWNHILDIELADPAYYQPGRIDVLLGADVGAHIMLSGLIKGQPGEPMAQHTQLGWILSGPVGKEESRCNISTFHHRIDLDRTLKSFWEQEEMPNVKQPTPEEEECETHFINNHSRDLTGRYTVSLPFKNADAIGKSKYRALTRLNQLKNQLNRKPDFKQQYHDNINEYLKLGHMVPSSSAETHGYYLPHHAVIKESSTTTKMRIVFDASAKSTTGVSLNDTLLIGPTIQQSLPKILLRWRTHRIALSADITKMYRQIRVKETDTHFQKILWRSNDSLPIEEYRLQTLTFGTASAAFLAIRTLHQLALDERQTFEDASCVVLNDFYVDDLLSGADSINEAKTLQKNLRNLLHKGGFELRKWISNSSEVLAEIPEEIRETTIPLTFDNEDTTKTLGILYNASTDSFKFKIQLAPVQKQPTKRSLLSESAKLFDPLGWLAPVIVKAKIMFQLLWKKNMAWDEKLDAITAEHWLAYRSELVTLENITIPRWTGHTKQNKCSQLHGFCDASETAYAAVVYIRTTDSDGNITTRMLTAKTKVAPIKTISLPRLELCGAVLLNNLMEHTKEALCIADLKLFGWTDSSIVLAWLGGHPSKWKTFVANRVAEIDRSVNRCSWNHVRSEDNPADCASRGIRPSELKDHPLWWKGPKWLGLPDERWPKQTLNFSTDDESKSSSITLFTTSRISLQCEIENHSSFTKLTRVIATCRRFIHNCQNTSSKLLGPLTVIELNDARNICVRSTQEAEFSKEIESLTQNTSISNNSKLSSLAPFMHSDGLLRVGGRLQNSTLSQSQKHPVILPSKHHYTDLVIQEAHIRTEHGGVQLTTTLLRNTYWILQARRRVKAIIRRCVVCHRYSPATNNQQMGPLPSVRTTEAPPFYNAAVDYAGPLDIKTSKLRNSRTHKCWIALFICMATKAIHIEVVSDLTTQAYLAAFTRFAARRGTPAHIYSDNGTTFVGANKELTRRFKNMLHDPAIADSLAIRATQWHFIPPRSPHFGGLWEAGIKAMKKHLRKILGTTTLTYEELTTTLASIEACLNSRPLTPLSDDHNDYAALTPGHFLIGRELLAPPCTDYSNTSNSLNKWRLTQKIAQDFWKRWRTDYVSSLQQRHKWKNIQRQSQVGDMVLLKDDDSPPSKWILCRIVKVHAGKDNLVRVVTLRTPHTTLQRAITKICPLPLNDAN